MEAQILGSGLFLLALGIVFCIWSMLRTAETKLSAEAGRAYYFPVSSIAVLVLTSWLIVVFSLSWHGIFESGRYTYFQPIALAVVIPVIAGYLLLSRSARFLQVLVHIPQHWLVAVQAYRAVGVLFLILYAAEKVPAEFALPAGIGDIIVGVTAPVVAYIYAVGYKNACLSVLLWNIFGIVDLILAISLGFLSSPGPLQLLALENPNQMITAFPLVLIPAFTVPLALILHLASLRLLREIDCRAQNEPT